GCGINSAVASISVLISRSHEAPLISFQSVIFFAPSMNCLRSSNTSPSIRSSLFSCASLLSSFDFHFPLHFFHQRVVSHFGECYIAVELQRALRIFDHEPQTFFGDASVLARGFPSRVVIVGRALAVDFGPIAQYLNRFLAVLAHKAASADQRF